MNCADDFVVAGAATKIAGELEADFVLAGIVSLVEQRFGGDEETGGADAALQRGAFQKALLQRMQVALLGQAFDGLDLGPFGFGGKDDAAIDRQAVHQHGAGAAIAVVAAFFGPGQAQVFAQDLEEALPRFAEELGWLAIDGRRNVEFFGRHGCKRMKNELRGMN